MIENVVSLPTNSQAEPFTHNDCFVEGHIEVHPGRLTENAESGISPRVHRRQAKRRGIEVTVEAVREVRRIADLLAARSL